MIEKFVKIDEKIVIEKEKLKLSDKTQKYVKISHSSLVEVSEYSLDT